MILSVGYRVRSQRGIRFRKVTRKEADEKAAQEYEDFSERRRLAIEARAEADQIRELEDLARKLHETKPAKEDEK